VQSQLARGEEKEEKKIFNFKPDQAVALSSEPSRASVIHRETTPGERDKRFGDFYLSLELESQAESGMLKHNNPD